MSSATQLRVENNSQKHSSDRLHSRDLYFSNVEPGIRVSVSFLREEYPVSLRGGYFQSPVSQVVIYLSED